MARTLRDLCEKETELAASVKETLLQIGHHLIGEHLIDSETAKRISRNTEMSAAHYIADRLYNSVIIPNGESFEEFLESLGELQTEQAELAYV